MKHLDRREFIKLSTAALGGIILTGCGVGSGGGGSATPTNFPNGYRFYRVKQAGGTVRTGSGNFRIDKFFGSTNISSNGMVVFDAVDTNKRRGLFQLALDFDSCAPRIASERAAFLSGQELADGRIVRAVKGYDTDDRGNIAAVLEADSTRCDHYGSGLYVDLEQSGFLPLLVAGDTFNEGQSTCNGLFGDVSLQGSRVLATAGHQLETAQTATPQESLIHIYNFNPSSLGILMSKNDPIPETDHKLSAFGLLDLNDGGTYSAALFAKSPSPSATNSTNTAAPSASFNIRGNIATPLEPEIMTASPNSGFNGISAVGAAGYGTRIGPDGAIYSVVGNGDDMTILKDQETILGTGTETSTGKLLGVSTGSVGADGLYYYTAITEQGSQVLMSVYAYDGQTHTPLISTGDVLSDGGAPVEQILFGTSASHVDSEGRLVFLCAFRDQTTALVVGVPC